ncbi:hypothetical protein K458DRAFT_361291 [Lentithecium fluviatile CBS 122367]|uniref:DASH complex subunit DAD1 n=1 Tax=Lentithecium fluviatile CBS 122367 TaxID=1168545 RepID=A0A6G1JDN0_9PLEO|nr:hypothetical protein K458DRAFT_361291 [Lentithecium fluviatile CBS 122367]
MATNARASSTNGTQPGAAADLPKSYYEQQRELLISEITQSLEHVLQNINRLNRSLEEVIQVGNEFAPVESLWSHFESVMGAREEELKREGGGEEQGEREDGREGGREHGDGEEGAEETVRVGEK